MIRSKILPAFALLGLGACGGDADDGAPAPNQDRAAEVATAPKAPAPLAFDARRAHDAAK